MPEEPTTLLAFKPFLLDMDELTLHPYYLPDFVWPHDRVTTSPCEKHERPVEGCTCGIVSTIDPEVMLEFRKTLIDKKASIIPIMGVIQVLGHTIVTGKTLRSWGGFLWGLVTPIRFNKYRLYDAALNMFLSGGHNPVIYETGKTAWYEVKDTLINYGIWR